MLWAFATQAVLGFCDDSIIMAPYGSLRHPMDSSDTPCDPHGTLWVPMALYLIPMAPHGSFWHPMDSCGSLWIPVAPCRFSRQPDLVIGTQQGVGMR